MKINLPKYPQKGERKIKIQIDPWDAWNAFIDLSLIIHPLLIELKKQKQSSCPIDNEDVPIHLRGTIDVDYNDSTVHEKWDWVLDEMIWTFGQILEDDYKINKDRDDRVKNGLRLFGKYFQGLWD